MLYSPSLVIAFASSLAGAYSAFYWFKSAKLRFVSTTVIGRPEGFPVMEHDLEGYFGAMANLNARGAIGAAVAVVLGAVSNLMNLV